MGTHWMTKYELMNIEPTYFCPKHNKSKADAIMGTLSGVLEAAAASKTITTLDEVENIYKNWASRQEKYGTVSFRVSQYLPGQNSIWIYISG